LKKRVVSRRLGREDKQYLLLFNKTPLGDEKPSAGGVQFFIRLNIGEEDSTVNVKLESRGEGRTKAVGAGRWEMWKFKHTGSRCPLCLRGRMQPEGEGLYACNGCGCRFDSEVLAVNAAPTPN
jgi:hypothetical protein